MSTIIPSGLGEPGPRNVVDRAHGRVDLRVREPAAGTIPAEPPAEASARLLAELLARPLDDRVAAALDPDVSAALSAEDITELLCDIALAREALEAGDESLAAGRVASVPAIYSPPKPAAVAGAADPSPAPPARPKGKLGKAPPAQLAGWKWRIRELWGIGRWWIPRQPALLAAILMFGTEVVEINKYHRGFAEQMYYAKYFYDNPADIIDALTKTGQWAKQ